MNFLSNLFFSLALGLAIGSNEENACDLIAKINEENNIKDDELIVDELPLDEGIQSAVSMHNDNRWPNGIVKYRISSVYGK